LICVNKPNFKNESKQRKMWRYLLRRRKGISDILSQLIFAVFIER